MLHNLLIRSFCLFLVVIIPSVSIADAGERHSAILTKYVNKVRIKGGNSIGWKGARKNMKLYANDRIRTMDNSSAIASYSAFSKIMIKENSLVVIKRMVIKEKVKTADIELSGGNITGKIGNDIDEDVVLVISANPEDSDARVEIDSRSNDKKSEVDISMDANKDMSVYVSSGNATVTSEGKTVKLNENESTFVESGSPPLVPWLGKAKPYRKIIFICLIFVALFGAIGGVIVYLNKKSDEEE